MWKTAPKTLTAYFLERMKDFLSLEHKFNFFFLDCQDDNSIFSLDRLFYTRVSSHMCHPDTFRITGHYSTLSALFFCCAKFFILSFPSIWDSERVNPCHECCSLSRDFRDKSDRRRKVTIFQKHQNQAGYEWRKYEKLLMCIFPSFFLKFHLSDKKEIEVNMLT